MIQELEQCYCGIVFETPMLSGSGFAEHIDDGTHERARRVTVCGPCFTGLCGGCDRRRGNGNWRCQCNHHFFESARNHERAVYDDVRLLWSTWLAAGCPSELSRPS